MLCFCNENVLNSFVISIMTYDYTKEVPERVRFDLVRFIRELKRQLKVYCPMKFIKKNGFCLIPEGEPELKKCFFYYQ